ncbi:MAG: DM13 domain-containing protein [Acidimicrobiales bacterium]
MSNRATAVRRAMVAIALASLVLAGCGSDSDEQSSDNGPATSASPAIPFPSTLQTVPPIVSDVDPSKAAPRWEQVRVVTGNAPMELPPVSIVPGAIQWRVKWSCEGGSFIINMTPPPARPGPLVQSNCPGQGEGFSRVTGEVKLSVSGSGPWKATIEQQVDAPLNEPALPEMANAPVIGRGDFYNVEKTGKGTVILYQLADGRRALRIEPGFETINDPDLVIWLSSLPNPKTSKEMLDSPHVEISALKSTKGSQNYILPDNVGVDPIRSIGLFCVPVPAIYVAATLS